VTKTEKYYLEIITRVWVGFMYLAAYAYMLVTKVGRDGKAK